MRPTQPDLWHYASDKGRGPDLDLKIRRSLEGAVRKIKFRLLLQRELLRVQVFLINVRCSFTYARGHFFGPLD